MSCERERERSSTAASKENIKLPFEEKIFGGEQDQTGDCRVTRIFFIKITGNNTRPTRSSLGMRCEKRGPQIITPRISCLIYPVAILLEAAMNQTPIKAGKGTW